MGVGRGHPLVRIGREDAADHFPLIRLARHDGNVTRRELSGGRKLLVEPQAGFALTRVGPVALVTIGRENRFDIAAVGDCGSG